ncbi:MAG: MBL fold metallo-hydrolase [Actinomycetota bacterium]
MEITVLGAGSAYPRPGGACSGFFLATGSARVWIDAGNGTFSRLQQVTDHRELDALILTHGHADHVADVLPFMYAIGFDPDLEAFTVPVYSPGDVGPGLGWPLGGTSLEMFRKVFDFRPIAKAFEIRDVSFEPFRTFHPAETYGLRMRQGERTIVYTSDTALYPELAAACQDADLLICEATYTDAVKAEPGVHLWAREAGEVAAKAAVKRLVLTHVWPTLSLDDAVAEASATFGGPVEAAVEGKTYSV